MAECIGTISWLISGLVLAASDPIVIATDAPFPAYVDIDSAGEIVGFERDLMDGICQRAALTCSWTLANFDALLPGVMAGDYDVVLGGMSVTEERREMVDFTGSYHFTDAEEWYIGRPGAPEPAQALIGVQSGTVQEAHVRKMGYRMLSLPTEAQVLATLAEGRVDLALGPYETRKTVKSFMQANRLEYLYSEMIPDDGVAMAVCKGNTDLLDTLNAALDGMRSDGTLESLEARWFP